MQVDVGVTGLAASSEELSSLQDWIRDERIPGLIVQRKSQPPPRDQMGIDPGILSVVLAAPALVELVRSIHVWITARRKEIAVVVKTHDAEVTLTAQNISDIDKVLEKIMPALDAERQPE